MSTRSDDQNMGHNRLPSPGVNGSEKETQTRPPSLSGNSDKYYHQEDGVTKIEALCEYISDIGECIANQIRHGVWQRMETVPSLGIYRFSRLRLLVSPATSFDAEDTDIQSTS